MPKDMPMCFFKAFLPFGSIELCGKHVKIPDSIDNSNNDNAKHTAAAFIEAHSSADAVSIACSKIS